MDAAERAHKLVTDQGDYTKRRVTLAESAIIQAEQAARQDERRKVLEEAAVVAERFGMAALSPSGVVVMKHCAEKIRSLAEEVT